MAGGKIGRVRGIYGGPVAKKLKIELTDEALKRMGECLVKAFVKEAKKDFAKRGWSGEAKDGSLPIWDSFSFIIRGERTIEVQSTFPDIDVLVSQDIPPRKMTWLTQEGKDKSPPRYKLSPREAMEGAKKGNRLRVDPTTGEVRFHKNARRPLIVPLKTRTGTVVFRMAPLKTQDAWIHPGIARFTFVDRAVRSGKAACIKIMQEEAVKALVQEMSK